MTRSGLLLKWCTAARLESKRSFPPGNTAVTLVQLSAFTISWTLGMNSVEVTMTTWSMPGWSWKVCTECSKTVFPPRGRNCFGVERPVLEPEPAASITATVSITVSLANLAARFYGALNGCYGQCAVGVKGAQYHTLALAAKYLAGSKVGYEAYLLAYQILRVVVVCNA